MVGLNAISRTVDIALQLRITQVAKRVDAADQLVELKDCKTACKNDQGIGENSVENCPPRYVS